jgi:hypothetical protein
MANYEYLYPVYTTQYGGMVRWVGDTRTYIFVEKPNYPGELDVGDTMPQEWSVTPANEEAWQARRDAEDFNQDLNDFFDLMFEMAERGEMSYDQIEQFFPPEVRSH